MKRGVQPAVCGSEVMDDARGKVAEEERFRDPSELSSERKDQARTHLRRYVNPQACFCMFWAPVAVLETSAADFAI